MKEQIEEMAKEICCICHAYKNCVNTTPCTMAYKEAEELYNADYRKAEVAREIFEEIDSILEILKKVVYKGEAVVDFENPVFAMCYLSKYEELKKKYTGGE